MRKFLKLRKNFAIDMRLKIKISEEGKNENT